ncbi:MAG: hypothetical protein QM747_15195 [Nocardioides sp.]
MTTTPQEPDADPDIFPSGDPEPIPVDPVAPGDTPDPDESDLVPMSLATADDLEDLGGVTRSDHTDGEGRP